MAFGPSGNRGACVPLPVEEESEDGKETAKVPSTEVMNVPGMNYEEDVCNDEDCPSKTAISQ